MTDLDELLARVAGATTEHARAEPRAPAPGKSTLTARLPPSASSIARTMVTQRRADLAAVAPTAPSAAAVTRTAETGVSGATGRLPFADVIAGAFGRHDISDVRVAIGGAATDASEALGAHAYATGNTIAFAREPDLHLAAHEAAHVVQQRGGVQLSSGLGASGDRHEQHADQVADAVVRGQSAEALLDAYAGGTASRAVQRFEADDGDDLDLADLRHDGRGGWTRPDGRRLSLTELARLRAELPSHAARAGLTEPQQARYRAWLDNPANGAVDPETWRARHLPLMEDHERAWSAQEQALEPGDPNRRRTDTGLHPPRENEAVRQTPVDAAEAPSNRGLGDPTPAAQSRSFSVRDEDREVHRVDQGRETHARDDDACTTGGLESCAAVGLHGQDARGDRIRLAHPSADATNHGTQYEHLEEAVVLEARQGGEVNGLVRVDPSAQRRPAVTDDDHVGDDAFHTFPATHDELLGRLQQRLAREFPDHDVARDGDHLVVTGRDGTVHSRIGVGIVAAPTDDRGNPQTQDVTVTRRGFALGTAGHAAPHTIPSEDAPHLRPESEHADEPDAAPAAAPPSPGPAGEAAPDPDEGGRSFSGSVDNHGGAAQVESNPTGSPDDARSVGINYRQETDGAGNVVGRDVGANLGRGPISGQIDGGYTFDVQPAAEQPGGSFQVSWTVSLRGGASGAHAGRGGGGSANVTRSGTHVSTGGTREENRAAAERYREDFRSHAVREFERAVGRELGTPGWWASQPEGTSRRVAVGGGLSASGSATILASIGASGELSASEEAEVTRGAGNTVTVTQAWQVTGGASGTAGVVVNTSYGGDQRRGVRETFAVDLVTGEAAFAAFLAHEHPLEPGQTGVTLRARREEEGSGSRGGVGVIGVGDIQGGESTGEIREQQFDANGRAVGETVTETGEQHHEGSTTVGDYGRRSFEVQAPDTGDDYRVDSNLHGSEGDESAAMLGQATGEDRAGARARSSGNWIVSQNLTQEEALRFHRNLLAGERPGLGSPLADVYDALRSVPTDDDELAASQAPAAAEQLRQRRRQRGAAISELLSEDGDRGLQLVRAVAGGTNDERHLRLFHDGGEDLTPVGDRSAEEIASGEDNRSRVPTFLGRDRSDEMARWIAARARGPVAPADVGEARQRMTDLDARIAQIADVDNYRDLPPAARAAELARYRGYRQQLGAIVERATEAGAAEMSDEGQQHHGDLRALQDRVNAARHQVDGHRAAVIGFRERFGEARSEAGASAQLPANIASRTGAMWSSAEGAYQGGEDALAAAEQRLATSVSQEETRNETDQRSGYRSAAPDLERALAAYGTARDEMARLERVYQRYDAHRGGEPEQAPDESPGASSTAGEETAPAARREAPRDRTPQRLVIPAALLAPHIHPRTGAGLEGLDRAAPVDEGPVTLPIGMVVRLLRARPVELGSEDQRRQLASQHGQHAAVWNVDLEIVTPAPDADAFVVNAMRDVARRGGPQVVPNQAGERFVGSVVVAGD